ncbi:MAG: histidine--tRNA ligase [Nitrospinae bacterium RIFCSPLOWO2_02_FULL_39_110]|nr:MAG: histidine--tRNA ligase [Nitrospinae bacterium RIFCSPHIGHO2_02_39_11]OGW00221.1 MAG: histidine--tRNA ligase [Nitrospinae bacterium RIFCSPHIGHO2_12_FULL_39_42]OGW01518.1 MAG: histidine--tRNA ligase [Nitrospinae bacterium RIFCSPHIGHO2_02_FULL_39_82]OGW03742.1 MAG: histidine--tRNA ligase [Nitrospinae bacterium RIFCSPLOWO2_02_39_17]OGW04078.1 MAG: histidine--tRNA ligase [Nitrospinae bacterium RIFCSPLOWO2_02_FULL_39_110]OGW08703.1 MAG: histidine--tRNA ligase [Nitrospinae bacterium RIFCSPLOWO
MTIKYQAIKGVKDILPGETEKWQFMEMTAREVFECYGFSEIRIPIFEKTVVFTRSIGETTDIVEKEMYTFTNGSGDSLTLRPEGTASVVRAYVEHNLYNPPSVVKLYYMGPMFRCERPQAGRYRQFYQIGAEVFGTENPEMDAESIGMLIRYFERLGLKDLELQINSLGCDECRPKFRKALLEFLKDRKNMLCEDCQRRFERNPLRIFDCKSANCHEATKESPTIESYMCENCKSHFDSTLRYLDKLNIPHTENPKLVRGLDYYTKTAFEIVSKKLGAQNTIAGGGRYDKLIEEFGGPPTPAFGFAIGIDRTASLMEDKNYIRISPQIFIATVGEKAGEKAFELIDTLRLKGIRVERDYENSSLKSQLRKADRAGVKYTIIIGEDEINKGRAILRDMPASQQEEIEILRIEEIVSQKLR